jgi:uncharacterized membrane protein YidH (DUF202 family)
MGELQYKIPLVIFALIHALGSGLSYFDVIKINDDKDAFVSHSTYKLISTIICLLMFILSALVLMEEF